MGAKDLNEILRDGGPDAVLSILNDSAQWAPAPGAPSEVAGQGGTRGAREQATEAAEHTPLRSVKMSEVQPEPVRWLWTRRIPLGMLSFIEGDPDVGKSTALLDIAARVTLGHAMPGEEGEGPPGNVIMWAPEDPAAQVIRPRLDAAGADTERVRLITDPLTLPDDVGALEAMIQADGARLLIIEPLTGALSGRTDSYKDHDVRRALMPLVELAQRTGAAVVAIRHLRKGEGSAIYRGGGSVAFGALARSVLAVGRDPADPEARIMARTKGNLSPLPPALRYRFVTVNDVARIEWLGECNITADELLQTQAQKRKAPALESAIEVVRELLLDGPMLVADLDEQAQAAGVSAKTLRRAKEALGVRSKQVHGVTPPQWTLSLPLNERTKGARGGKVREGQKGQQAPSDPLDPLVRPPAREGERPDGQEGGRA